MLCSEPLSQRDNYELSAVKSMVVMAGSLKHQDPDKKEDVVLRVYNWPTFHRDHSQNKT